MFGFIYKISGSLTFEAHYDYYYKKNMYITITNLVATFTMADVIKNSQSLSYCLYGSGSQSVFQGL